jgi:peptidoglycan hydrolase FlgJ
MINQLTALVPAASAMDVQTGQTAARSASGRDPDKVHDAAQQFEALLLGQMLRSVRESNTGWMGSGGDAAGNCATDFAEQQFATVMAQQGGLGLATLITKGLTPGK